MPFSRVILLFSIIFPGKLFAQENSLKETGFPLAVGLVAAFLEKQDSTKLLRYTSKSLGVYVLYSDGGRNSYQHFKTLELSNIDYKGVLVTPPVYINLGDYCKKSGDGTFADTATVFHPLSEIASAINKADPGIIPESKIREFQDLENLSRRVVVIHNGKRMVFYLGYVVDRWMLTIVDVRDCGR